MDDLISIIIPVYKVEKYLARCIDSILQQTYSNLEIILVNDGSPDNCGNICDEYSKKDSRITVIHKENGGVSSARNMGLKVAKGKYIGFVDSDDYIELDMFEKLYKILKKNEAQLSVCNIYGKNEDKLEIYDNKQFIEIIFDQNGPQGYLCNKLYDKSVIDKFNLILDENIHICEDLLFNVNYLEKIKKVVYIHEGFYHYVENSSSATKKMFATKRWTTLLDSYIAMEPQFKNYEQKLYDLYLSELLWAAVRVRTEMQISKVKYPDVIKKYRNIIKTKRKQFLKSKNISLKIKIKIILYMYFYKIISILKKIKRNILN